MVSDGRHLFYCGGAAAGVSNRVRTVYSARLEADGGVGPWRVAGVCGLLEHSSSPNIPAAVYHDGYIYMNAGGPGADFDVFFSWRVGPDGTLGPPKRSRLQVSATLSAAVMVVSGGWLYFVGGLSTVPPGRSVWAVPLMGDGDLGAARVVSEFPTPDGTGIAHHCLVTYGGYLYLLGGNNPSSTSNSWVWSAKLEPGGGIGPWRRVGDLPVALERAGACVVNDRVLVFGGRTAPSTVRAEAYSAPLLPGGQVGAFGREEDMPVPLRNLHTQSAVAGGRLYLVGGIGADNATSVNDVRSVLVT